MENQFGSILIVRIIGEAIGFVVFTCGVLLILFVGYLIAKRIHSRIDFKFKKLLFLIPLAIVVCLIKHVPAIVDICADSDVYAENAVLVPHRERSKNHFRFEAGNFRLTDNDGNQTELHNIEVSRSFYEEYEGKEMEFPLVIYAEHSKQLLYPDFQDYSDTTE